MVVQNTSKVPLKYYKIKSTKISVSTTCSYSSELKFIVQTRPFHKINLKKDENSDCTDQYKGKTFPSFIYTNLSPPI